MRSEDIVFIKDDMNKSHDELLSVIVDLRKQLLEYEGYITENSAAITVMSKEYQKLKEEKEYLLLENKALSEALTLIAEKNLLRTNDLFGRGSEKLSDAMDYTLEDIGEIDESDTEDSYSPDTSKEGSNRPPQNPSGTSGSTTKGSRKPKSSTDVSGLPSITRFLLNISQLNATYGEGNWRIAFWRSHKSLEHVKSPIYVVNYFTPVISVGLEHNLKTIPYDSLLPKSMVSASLMSEIYYQKVFMGNPLYRIAQSLDNYGLTLTRQTLSNWFIFFAFEFFAMIKERLQELMLLVPYHQCDESTLQVIHDGRKAGAKSYIWVHTTSELCDKTG